VQMQSKREEVQAAFNKLLEEKNSAVLLQTCETLSKLIGNLVNAPDQPKFRRVPCASRVFNEKVVEARGGAEFITAVGFQRQTIDEADFWVIDPIHGPDVKEALGLALELLQARLSKAKKTATEVAEIDQMQSSLRQKSIWNDTLPRLSWRIDVKARSRSSNEEISIPTAIFELEINAPTALKTKVDGKAEDKDKKIVRFEMSKEQMAVTLHQLATIQKTIDLASQK